MSQRSNFLCLNHRPAKRSGGRERVEQVVKPIEPAPFKLPFDVACLLYPHRFTAEHVPTWAKTPAPNGKFYAPQFASDQEWYDNTTFPIRVRDQLAATRNQTWPFGQWLTEPYSFRERLAEMREECQLGGCC